jgi:hypothetical protein
MLDCIFIHIFAHPHHLLLRFVEVEVQLSPLALLLLVGGQLLVRTTKTSADSGQD